MTCIVLGWETTRKSLGGQKGKLKKASLRQAVADCIHIQFKNYSASLQILALLSKNEINRGHNPKITRFLYIQIWHSFGGTPTQKCTQVTSCLSLQTTWFHTKTGCSFGLQILYCCIDVLRCVICCLYLEIITHGQI